MRRLQLLPLVLLALFPLACLLGSCKSSDSGMDGYEKPVEGALFHDGQGDD